MQVYAKDNGGVRRAGRAAWRQARRGVVRRCAPRRRGSLQQEGSRCGSSFVRGGEQQAACQQEGSRCTTGRRLRRPRGQWFGFRVGGLGLGVGSRRGGRHLRWSQRPVFSRVPGQAPHGVPSCKSRPNQTRPDQTRLTRPRGQPSPAARPGTPLRHPTCHSPPHVSLTHAHGRRLSSFLATGPPGFPARNPTHVSQRPVVPGFSIKNPTRCQSGLASASSSPWSSLAREMPSRREASGSVMSACTHM